MSLRPLRHVLSSPTGSLAVALAALGLAAIAEATLGDGSSWALGVVLYLAAIVLFAVGSVRGAPGPSIADPEVRDPTPWRATVALLAAAVTLGGVSILLVWDDASTRAGAWLWLTGLAAIVGAGIRLRGGWRPLWATGARPRPWVLAAGAGIVLAAALARFVALDRIPKGINADEGDRAAVAIQFARGQNGGGVFDFGWYYVSNVYFWLLGRALDVTGISYHGARAFGALAGTITVLLVVVLGVRHFGVRVGLLAGALLALLGIALQFSRETTEATPTAMLWTASALLLLEGVRSGRAWAWAAAGICGGLTIYFYTTGRLWPVFAAVYCAYLLVRLADRRRALFGRVALCGLGAAVAIGPFMAAIAHQRELFFIRARQVSVLADDNWVRLPYQQEDWSALHRLWAQLGHGLGLFGVFPDGGGFWPTDRPALVAPLAVLTLVGVGWSSVRVKDPRHVLLALWFWTGVAGVILTVETPNVQRLAIAVPALALFPALVLDDVATRLERVLRERAIRRPAWVATAAVAGAVVALGAVEGTRYFRDYGRLDAWPAPNLLGDTVAAQGRDTLVVTVGRNYHMINAGWVRLLAPNTPRGGAEAPGSQLPLALAADRNLAFLLFQDQAAYLPYLRSVYPGGTARTTSRPNTEDLVIYEVPVQAWAGQQGARAWVSSGRSVPVETLGAPAAEALAARWTAGLRVPRFGDYRFRIGPGPAELSLDGQTVLRTRGRAATRTLRLARGLHFVEYRAAHQKPLLWGPVSDPPRPPSREELAAGLGAPAGLLGTVSGELARPERLLDPTLAECCLADRVGAGGAPYAVVWRGSLRAPATGSYRFEVVAQGAFELLLDGRRVIRAAGAVVDPEPVGAAVALAAGRHRLEVRYRPHPAQPGVVELVWTPPGGERSIVPPSALEPAPGAVAPATGPDPGAPVDAPLVTTP